MKKDSDNIRQSPLIDTVEQLISLGRTVYIYEPILDKNVYHPQLQIVDDVSKLATNSNLIVANRVDHEIDSLGVEIYTADLFNKN